MTNTAQVLHPNLSPPSTIPTLPEIFQTDRDSHWLCTFKDRDGNVIWETAAYFYAGMNGESVYNRNPSNPSFPNHFEFTWSGEQALSIVTPVVPNLTLFDFVWENCPDKVMGASIIYQFVAGHSLGGLVVGAKVEGRR